MFHLVDKYKMITYKKFNQGGKKIKIYYQQIHQEINIAFCNKTPAYYSSSIIHCIFLFKDIRIHRNYQQRNKLPKQNRKHIPDFKLFSF